MIKYEISIISVSLNEHFISFAFLASNPFFSLEIYYKSYGSRPICSKDKFILKSVAWLQVKFLVGAEMAAVRVAKFSSILFPSRS